MPFWAQLFAFVIVVLKWRRKEAVAERQTSTPPIFAISVRLLRAVYGSMLVIARQTFAKIGQVTLTPALWGRADSA